jgi:hypothetical protein
MKFDASAYPENFLRFFIVLKWADKRFLTQDYFYCSKQQAAFYKLSHLSLRIHGLI